MAKIKVMSENLANKIAAGEVVEKCASVVKELVENSIDSGATKIKVDLLNAGLKEIKVTDDGIGMEADDALLAFQRHATSKLTREDDLFFINTLGFRGEALPSIASVSEVDLITCASNVGTHIHIKGGKLEINEPADARKGTILTVSNLFFNTPVRLKYLKSEQYELSNSVSFIEKLAFSYPDIKFELTNNGKTLVKTSGSGNLLKVIHEIYGLSVSSNMMEVKGTTDDYDMEGYICKPEVLKSNANHMITIVNGRVIKNYEINKAINDAYFRYKPDIKYPVVVLKFVTDPTLIDVNIHPTKQDIKLSKMEVLYEMIVDVIGKKLQEELLIPNALKDEAVVVNLPKTLLEDGYAKKDSEHNKIKEDVQEEDFNLFTIDSNLSDCKSIDENSDNDNVILEDKVQYKRIGQRLLNPEMKLLDLYVVGQVLGTYIVCQNDTGLFLVDQHAAKERVNYEMVQEKFKQKDVSTMEMLFPITLEYSSSDALLIKENLNIMQEMGFDISEFGINTFMIKSHPSWLGEGHEEEIIRTILDEIIKQGGHFDRVRFNNKLIATIACKMSVRANTRLSREGMEEIIKELVNCKNPYNCAHGRPAIVKFSSYDLERMFKRVMN